MLTEENPGISILRWKRLGFLIMWRTPSDILYYNEKGRAGRLSLHTDRRAARRKASASRSIRRVCADCFQAKTAFYHKIIVFVFMDSPCDFRWRSLAPQARGRLPSFTIYFHTNLFRKFSYVKILPAQSLPLRPGRALSECSHWLENACLPQQAQCAGRPIVAH